MIVRFSMLLGLAVVLAGCSNVDNPLTSENEAADSETTSTVASKDSHTDDDDAVIAEHAAKCNLVAIGGSNVSGAIHFEQEGDRVHVYGEIRGLEPGKHGFHVHEKGDLSDKETGKSAGGHFSPEGHDHGKPSDEMRHVGDLGNIEANEDGLAVIDMWDDVIALTGDHSILERSIVVHAKEDTFGQPTGDAGARVAFGKIVDLKQWDE